MGSGSTMAKANAKKKATLTKEGYKPVEVKSGRGGQTETVYQKTISRTDPSIADDSVAKALGGTVSKTVSADRYKGRGRRPDIYTSSVQEAAQIAKGSADIARQMARQLLPNATPQEIDSFILGGVSGSRHPTLGSTGNISVNPGTVIGLAAQRYAEKYPDKFQYTPEMQSWVANARGQLEGRSKDIWKSWSGGSESFGQAIAPYVGMAASAFAPGLSNLLGGGITGGALAGGTIGGGMAALQGGDIGKGMLSGAVSGGLGASGIGNTIGKAVGGALDVTSPLTQNALNKGFTGGINTFAGGLLGGKNLSESLKLGALSGLGSGVSSYVGGNLMKTLGGAGVNKDLAGFLAGTAGGTAAGMIRGQDFRNALTNAAVGSAANTAGAMAGRYADTGNRDFDKMISGGVKSAITDFAKSALAPSPVQRQPVRQGLSPLRRPLTGMVSGRPTKEQILAILSQMPPTQRQALLARMQGQAAPQQMAARPTIPTPGLPTTTMPGLPTMPTIGLPTLPQG